MKNIKIAVLLFMVSISALSQETSTENVDTPKMNEIKLNGLSFVLGALDVSYERILNEDSSLGVNMFLTYDDDIYLKKYHVSPYYRYFFSKKHAAGFFIEAFGMLNEREIDDIYYAPTEEYPNGYYRDGVVTDFALGFGVGGKWVTKKGFVAQVNGGIGRNLFNNEEGSYGENDVVGKIGLTLGYRF